MDTETVLYPFQMAIEAINSLTALQLTLLNIFLVLMTGGALASGYVLGRKVTKREIIEASTVVAIELDPKSPLVGTYEVLGDGFVNNDSGGALTITPTSRVTTLGHARAVKATRRPSYGTADLPLGKPAN